MLAALQSEDYLISVILLSVLSGVGSYLQGRREDRLKGCLLDFFTEVTLAVVVGLIVSFLCGSYGLPQGYTSALVLITSNNGADTLDAFKKVTSQALIKFLSTGGRGK